MPVPQPLYRLYCTCLDGQPQLLAHVAHERQALDVVGPAAPHKDLHLGRRQRRRLLPQRRDDALRTAQHRTAPPTPRPRALTRRYTMQDGGGAAVWVQRTEPLFYRGL